MNALVQISTFGNNAAALEKTLRLAQSCSQIGANLQVSAKDAAPWVMARGQFNLSRRFLRLHKWIDNFAAAAGAFANPNRAGVPKLLETAKFTFLGFYFLMEMFTITDVMGLTRTEWGPWVTVESNRFWFYGLACSVVLGLWDGLLGGQVVEAKKVKEKGAPEVRKDVLKSSYSGVLPYKQLAIDGCDLLIPGAVVGWTDVTPLVVSIAMSISTVLALSDMWVKIQAQAVAQSQKKK